MYGCREFVLAIKDWKGKKTEKPQITAIKKAGADNFPHIIAPLRHLTLASASLLLSRLDRMLRKIGHNTLVNDINRFRAKGVTAHHIINLVKREGDSDVTTGSEKLKFLTYGSPTMKSILYQIHTYVLPHIVTEKPRKLLITEDVALKAFFWDSVCNFAYVETEVLHAGLTDLERVNLVKRFSDPKDSLLILIIMYQVSAQGVNLDRCCCRVLVATPAINTPSEIQAWSRVIRVCYLKRA